MEDQQHSTLTEKQHPAFLGTTLRLTVVLLVLATWAIVWQARIIQQQKILIRQMSGITLQN